MKKTMFYLRTISALIVLILMAMPLTAQPKDGPPGERGPKRTKEERATRVTDMMNKKLSLSTEQYTKVYDAFLQQETSLDEMRDAEREKTTHDKDAIMQKVDAILGTTDSVMQTILSAEQYTQYIEVKKEMRDKMKERMKDNDRDKNDNNPPLPPEDGKF